MIDEMLPELVLCGMGFDQLVSTFLGSIETDVERVDAGSVERDDAGMNEMTSSVDRNSSNTETAPPQPTAETDLTSSKLPQPILK